MPEQCKLSENTINQHDEEETQSNKNPVNQHDVDFTKYRNESTIDEDNQVTLDKRIVDLLAQVSKSMNDSMEHSRASLLLVAKAGESFNELLEHFKADSVELAQLRRQLDVITAVIENLNTNPDEIDESAGLDVIDDNTVDDTKETL